MRGIRGRARAHGARCVRRDGERIALVALDYPALERASIVVDDNAPERVGPELARLIPAAELHGVVALENRAQLLAYHISGVDYLVDERDIVVHVLEVGAPVAAGLLETFYDLLFDGIVGLPVVADGVHALLRVLWQLAGFLL